VSNLSATNTDKVAFIVTHSDAPISIVAAAAAAVGDLAQYLTATTTDKQML